MVTDAYSLWEADEERKERWLSGRPVCHFCGEPIQEDHCFLIEGKRYCPECIEFFRVEIEEEY